MSLPFCLIRWSDGITDVMSHIEARTGFVGDGTHDDVEALEVVLCLAGRVREVFYTWWHSRTLGNQFIHVGGIRGPWRVSGINRRYSSARVS